MKLINSCGGGIQAAALAEGVALTEGVGIDQETALSVLANGAPGSPLVKAVGPRMLKHDYVVNFKLALMHKDLSYSIAEAERAGVPLRTAATARELFATALARGLGDKDFAAVVEPLRERK